MASGLHRLTLRFKPRAVDEADTATWVINPDMSPVEGVDPKYWKLTGDIVSEMSPAEKAAVDAAEAAERLAWQRSGAQAAADELGGFENATRALILGYNKRCNYLINRVEELQNALLAMKATNGPADNIRSAIPASFMATNTRPLPAAVQDFKDDIGAGNAD